MNKLFLYIKKLNKRTAVIVALTILEITLLSVAGISYGNKNFDKYSFSSKDLLNNSMFAIMLEDSTGNYKQTESNTFPGYEYFYNNTKSGCMSSNGKLLEDSLLYDQDNKKATVKVTSSSKCYLYFDRYKETSLSDKLIASNTLWQSGLEGDGYRYVGSGTVGESTNPNNFICFGTTDVAECTGNQDKYMYRIIGVFPDEKGNQHVKLIKYKQLGSYAWHSDRTVDTSWENSDMYKGLNGEYFLTNTAYDYLQNNTWLNKIVNWTWTAVNTLTSSNNGPNYNNELSPKEIYLHEMNRSAKTNTVGNWTTPTGKTGLMYVSDYTLSLGSSAASLTTGTSTNATLLKTGWMHQSNNDTTKSTSEWTISRYNDSGVGGTGSSLSVWNLSSNGSVSYGFMNRKGGTRPTIYLDSNITAGYGTGTLEDPFIITDSAASSTSLKVNLSNTDSTLNISITKGSGNLSKYCINNSTSINNCNWKKVTSNSIKYNMSSEGTYYVHVIDDQGFIANSLLHYKEDLTFAKYLLSNNFTDINLDGMGYEHRFIGEVTDTNAESNHNYVCFGTMDMTECTNSQDKYMYRIIGVFADSNNVEHVKLIKDTPLTELIVYDDTGTNIYFENSNIYQKLNGDSFLTSYDYPYMSDTLWNNKITNWNWNILSTNGGMGDGPSLSLSPVSGIYRVEHYDPNKITTDCLNYIGSNSYQCQAANFENSNFKIGLMYASDYALSLGSRYVNTTVNDVPLSTNWLFSLSQGMTSVEYELIMTTVGFNPENGELLTWAIGRDGLLTSIPMNNSTAISRPVFYLEADVYLDEDLTGTGTIDNPYILK